MNIFLIGFMGCGKSTIGKKIAKKMSYNFIDLDLELEKNEQKTVQSIFDSHGEDYFRTLESKWLENYKGNNKVISLGGGTPCFNRNIETINNLGTSVYLKMNSGLLTNRLYNSKQKRPLIEKYKDDLPSLKSKIESLLESREVFYNQANLIFEAQNMSALKIDELIRDINGFV